MHFNDYVLFSLKNYNDFMFYVFLKARLMFFLSTIYVLFLTESSDFMLNIIFLSNLFKCV